MSDHEELAREAAECEHEAQQLEASGFNTAVMAVNIRQLQECAKRLRAIAAAERRTA